MSLKRKIVAFVLFVAAVFWGGMWATHSSLMPTMSRPHKTEVESPRFDAPILDKALSPTVAPLVVPSVEVPFAEAYQPLTELARAGHDAAACRLAVEFQRCEEFQRLRLEHERWLADRQFALEGGILTRRPDLEEEFASEFERELRDRESSLEVERRHCEDAPTDLASRRVELWRNAALGGNRSAMRIYSSGAAFELDHMLELTSQMAVYKAEAEMIATKAAASGDIQMLVALSAAYSPIPAQSRPFLVQAVTKKDGAFALALLKHAVKTSSSSMPPPEAAMYVSDIVRRIVELESMLPAADRERAGIIEKKDLSEWSAPRFDSIAPNSRAFGDVEHVAAEDCNDGNAGD